MAVGCSDSSETTLAVIDRDASASGGASGAPAGTGGSHTGGIPQGTGGTASDAGPDASTGGAGAAGSDGGSDVDRADDGPGVLVAYDIRSTEKRLYVLDSETGRPLSSEAMGTVRAVIHDGARYPADRWYVVEQTGTVDRGVTVHVRSLEAATGVFRELGTLRGAPAIVGSAVSFGAPGTSFVAYLSELATGSLPSMDIVLTVIDVTDPTNSKLVATTGDLPKGSKLGLVADGDALNVVTIQGAPCPTASGGGQECDVSVVRANVTRSAVTIGSATVVGKTGPEGNAEFSVDPSRHLGLVALPPVAPPPSPACGATSRSVGTVQTFPIETAAPTTPVSIPVEAARFAGAAFDSCSGVLFLTSLTDDVAIWAVPLGSSGTTEKLCAGAGGGPIVYESSSRSLFRALSSGGLEAYRVDASGSAPKLTERALAELPPGFHFGALATRAPREPACP
jgi:hypothetical protein